MQYCSKCDTMFITADSYEVHDCAIVGKIDSSVLEREVWNAAIDAAAECAGNNGEGCCWPIWDEIRKLKK